MSGSPSRHGPHWPADQHALARAAPAQVQQVAERRAGRGFVTAFVTLDSIPLEPHFLQARQSGAIELTEYDEGISCSGLS